VRTIPRSGLVLANAAEESLRRVLGRGVWTPLEWFNASEGQPGWSGREDGETYRVSLDAREQGDLHWNLAGEHNRHNALAAIAAARHVGVPPEVAIEALGRFENVKRRLELRGEACRVKVYDDFAHHPTAIATTVAGLRRQAGTDRVLAVLEPRSNTMKLGVMKNKLPESLVEADRVFCYGAKLGWDAQAALAPMGEIARTFDNFEAMINAIVLECRPGDHVLVMSNGGFGGIHGKLLQALKARETT